MGVWSNIVNKFNRAQPAIASQQGEAFPENTIDYKEAYKEIEVVHRSIEIIINALCEIPYLCDNKTANILLNIKPNPWEDRLKLFRRAYLDFFIDGNTFFYYEKSTKSIYLLPANDVTIVPDERTYVKEYKYEPSGGNTLLSGTITGGSSEASVIFTSDEIIHIRGDSEDSIYRGDSKLKSLERLVELYYALINFQRQFFKNNAVPGFVLTTDNVLSKKIKDRLLQEWAENYTTIFKGARSPAILDGGLKIDSFSTVNFSELDFEKSVDRIQQDMAKALGVPYVLLKSGNNANITNNQSLFYLHTVIPILELFASAFSHKFSANIKPDKQSVSALRPDTKAEALFYSTLVNGGIITPNEARVGLRFKKLDDEESDSIRIPQNITGSATNPAKGGRPTGGGEENKYMYTHEDLKEEESNNG